MQKFKNATTTTPIDYSGQSVGWAMMFMAAYYDKPFTVLELLMLGADPALRLTATKRGHLGPGRCQITAVFRLMNEGNYTHSRDLYIQYTIIICTSKFFAACCLLL